MKGNVTLFAAKEDVTKEEPEEEERTKEGTIKDLGDHVVEKYVHLAQR